MTLRISEIETCRLQVGVKLRALKLANWKGVTWHHRTAREMPQPNLKNWTHLNRNETRKFQLGKRNWAKVMWRWVLEAWSSRHPTTTMRPAESNIEFNSTLKLFFFFFLNRNWLHGERRTQDCLHRRPALIIQCGPIHISLPILDAAKLRELLPYDRRKETCRKPTLFLLPGRPNIGNIITRHPLLKARLFDGADWIFQHAREKCLTKKNQTKPDTTDLRQTMKAMCCFPCVYLYGYDF